ncbi:MULTISPECIES: hypothetical protein [unclassified Luteimonas]
MPNLPMPSRDRKPSAAARYLIVFVLGMAVGIFAAVVVIRAIQARSDHFASSVMHVQEWHMTQLHRRAEENRCNPTDVLPHLRALRVLAEDLEPAFPRLGEDQRFARHAARMRATLDAALQSPPLNCAGVQTTNKQLQDSCRDCHRDFRS